MNPRMRKLIGLFAILAFLLVYVGLVVTLVDHVPEHGLWRPIFLILAGTLWGVPILPLLSWMNRER